jgi:alcohol dehydrogenase, propanol-preferring
VAHKLDVAKGLGAAYTVNAAEDDPVEFLQGLGGADAAVVLAANPSVCLQAYRSLRRGGRLVLVGLPADNELRLPIFETVLNGITIKGSIVGTHHDLEQVFALHVRGLTRVFRSESSLDEVNHAIEQVLDGSAPAPRTVFRMSPVESAAAGAGDAMARA